MSQNENKGSLITTEKGAVWNIEVGVWVPTDNSIKPGKQETKQWKIKVILN